jgi:hypothetical protein
VHTASFFLKMVYCYHTAIRRIFYPEISNTLSFKYSTLSGITPLSCKLIIMMTVKKGFSDEEMKKSGRDINPCQILFLAIKY